VKISGTQSKSRDRVRTDENWKSLEIQNISGKYRIWKVEQLSVPEKVWIFSA